LKPETGNSLKPKNLDYKRQKSKSQDIPVERQTTGVKQAHSNEWKQESQFQSDKNSGQVALEQEQ
jgi:hypothetical protein